MRRLGLIGAGGMAETILTALAEHLEAPLDCLSLLVTPSASAAAEALTTRFGPRIAKAITIHTDRARFIAQQLDLVAECAGQSAIADHGPAILKSGCDLIIVSVGSLADDGLREALQEAALEGASKLIVTSGAVGGLDILGAARLSGLHEVVYRGRKPPLAWRGTDAERLVDLDRVSGEVVFFQGTAREAASHYPQNANVAAAVALAGAGFDATRVELIADPAITQNVHEISVRSVCADFTICLWGQPSPRNPKTSLTAGFSVARNVLNHIASMTV